jgi:hypothetical protein
VAAVAADAEAAVLVVQAVLAKAEPVEWVEPVVVGPVE